MDAFSARRFVCSEMPLTVATSVLMFAVELVSVSMRCTMRLMLSPTTLLPAAMPRIVSPAACIVVCPALVLPAMSVDMEAMSLIDSASPRMTFMTSCTPLAMSVKLKNSLFSRMDAWICFARLSFSTSVMWRACFSCCATKACSAAAKGCTEAPVTAGGGASSLPVASVFR